MGYEIKRFLSKKKRDKKIPLKENEYFCPKCQRAVEPKEDSETTVETGRVIGKERKKQLVRKARCSECGCKINRFVRSS